VELQSRVDQLRQAGLGVAAISYDSVSVLADFANRRGITFPLLSDRESRTIKAFGLLNTSILEINPVYGIPFPGTLVLDSRGLVRARFFEEAYQERDSAASILLALGEDRPGSGAAAGAEHIGVTLRSSDGVVAPGTVFSVVIDVTPKERVHVYAPGVTGYRPVNVVIESQPGLIVRAIRFPEPEDYYFKPLGEHVKVFQKPFRIVQELMIDASQASQADLQRRENLVVRGRLDYQACDDKVCFTPASVPVTWSLKLKALDRERSQKR